MLKKVFVVLLCLVMILPTAVLAAGEGQPVLEKPVSFTVRKDPTNDNGLLLRFTQPDSIMRYVYDDITIFYELDWRINNGPWKFDSNWDGVVLEQGIELYYEEIYEHYLPVYGLNSIFHDERNSFEIPIFPWSLDVANLDLQNNTYSFRFRYLYEYDARDPVTGEWGYSYIAGPWSNVASIGKDADSMIPNKLDAPENLKVELKNRPNGQPYFYMTLDIPESVVEANQAVNVCAYVDWKIGDGKWATESGELPFQKGDRSLWDDAEMDPVDEGTWAEIDIKENTYYFRAYFEFQKPDGSFVRSPFSNVVSVGTPAFYTKANTWFEGELKDAYDLGLIPERLIGVDLTVPITREEFAELAVLLYEKTTGLASEPASPNPFTDTTNPEILKAFKIGITTGTSTTEFSPNVLINREQCATMLFRAIKAIHPDGDYSIAGVKDFPDQKEISSWAVEATKYMSKMGIILGDAKTGNFMPKANPSISQAYGMASREAAIVLSYRTYNKMPEIQQSVSGGSGSDSAGTGGASVSLPDSYPSGLIPIAEGGRVTKVEEKTFEGGHKGYLITVDHSGQKDSDLVGYYYSLMMDAEDLYAVIGLRSRFYGTKGGYYIEIDFYQAADDEYKGYVTIGYYKK